MRWLGIGLITAASVVMGFQIAASIRRRCVLLQDIYRALGLLRSELSCCATPLPQAFALLAAGSEGQTAALFSAAAKEMDRDRWLDPRTALAKAMTICPELEGDKPLRKVLLDLGSELGKYDMEQQMRALDLAMRKLDEIIATSEQERGVKCRLYRSLGVCTGLCVAILLI